MPQQYVGVSGKLVEDQSQMVEMAESGQGNGALNAQCHSSFVIAHHGRCQVAQVNVAMASSTRKTRRQVSGTCMSREPIQCEEAVFRGSGRGVPGCQGERVSEMAD